MKDSDLFLGPVLFRSSSRVAAQLRPQQPSLLLQFLPPIQIRVKERERGVACHSSRKENEESDLLWREQQGGVHAALVGESKDLHLHLRWRSRDKGLVLQVYLVSCYRGEEGTGMMRARNTLDVELLCLEYWLKQFHQGAGKG